MNEENIGYPPEDGFEALNNGGENSNTVTGSQPGFVTDTETERDKLVLKRSLSSVCSAISLGVIEIYVVAISIILLLAKLFNEVWSISITNSISSYMSVVALNIIGMSIFCIVMSVFIKKTPVKKQKKSGAFFIGAFAVCMLAMQVGAVIGSYVNGYIMAITGETIPPVVDSMVSDLDVFTLIFTTAVVPGICEELIFRKIIIDRLNGYSRVAAIIFSAAVFGLFHGNFEQFFYAFLVGLVLGYVYTETGNILHTMILHFAMNFVGAVIPTLMGDSTAGMVIYLFVIGVSVIGGIIALVMYFVLGKFDGLKKENTSCNIVLGGGELAKAMIFNVGTVIFIIFEIYMFYRAVVLT